MKWVLAICYVTCTWGFPDTNVYFDNKSDCLEAQKSLKEQHANFAFCYPLMEKKK